MLAAHAVNEVIPGIISISYLSSRFFCTYVNVENIDGSPNVTNATSCPLFKYSASKRGHHFRCRAPGKPGAENSIIAYGYQGVSV